MFLICLIVFIFIVYYIIKVFFPYPRYLGLAYKKPIMYNLYSWVDRSTIPSDATTPMAKLLEFTIETYCPKDLRKELHQVFYKARSLLPYYQPLIWAFKKNTNGDFYWEIYFYGLSVDTLTEQGAAYQELKITPKEFLKKMDQGNLNIPKNPFITSIDITIKNNKIEIINPVSYHATNNNYYTLPLRVESVNLKNLSSRSHFWIIYNNKKQLLDSAKEMKMPEKIIPKVLLQVDKFPDFKSMTFAWKKNKQLISIYPCGINIDKFESFLIENDYSKELIQLFKQYKKRFMAHEWDIVLNYNSKNMKLSRTGFAGSL